MVHQYVFEFKYKKVVFGKERELTHEVNVLDNNYQSACKKAIEHTKDHFHQWNDEGSSFKYVGEKINGVLKPFVEVKEETDVKMKKKSYEVMEMERHVYKFEFKYERQVNGKKTEFTVPVIVHNECYADACTKVDEFVRKNFADRVTEESTIKYVGEFVHGVLKPFVEVKEEEKMKTYVEMYEEMCGVQKKVEQLEKRVDYFEKKQEQLKPVKTKPLSIKTKEDLFGEWYCREDVNMVKKICAAIENKRPHVLQGFDVNSMYPQAVDVCKVYQIERDQALKENEELKKRVKYLIERNNRLEVNEKYYDEEYRKLSDEKQTHEMVINGYNKELSQLNLLMDDMEDRLEKQVVACDGMLKQLREYKEEKKRMNKIIDALTEDK